MNERQASGFTYQQAGVDNTSGARAKERIGQLIRQTYTDGVLGDFGHFGGMFRSPEGASTVLVSSADSVGTKVLLAVHAGRHDGIGMDLVNHSVNDILCCGARPLFFLDYFATSSLDQDVLADLVEGMSHACQAAGCALIGGETAQLPGIYQESTYDLAGFIVGVVEEERIIDGAAIKPGDAVIGFPSNGLHTNGYSLARAVFGLTGDDTSAIREHLSEHVPELGETLGDALLRPHRPYLQMIIPFVEQGLLSGMAHITGGGIVGNLERIIPAGCAAEIDVRSWEPPAIFTLLQQRGNVPVDEMFNVFNMGIGFIAVADESASKQIIAGEPDATVIGYVRRSTEPDARVHLSNMAT